MPEVEGYACAIAEVDERRRHLEVHGSGPPEVVRKRLDEMAASGTSGVMYLPAGDDIPRELEAIAGCAGL